MPSESAARELRHRRTIDCAGYLRADDLWEVEVRMRDTKPFSYPDTTRGLRQPGEPMHDIGLRLAVDDRMVIHEAEALMADVPFPTCRSMTSSLAPLVGERLGGGWRERVRTKVPAAATCTHLFELLPPAITTLVQTMSMGRGPVTRDPIVDVQLSGRRPFFLDGCHTWRADGPVVAELFPAHAIRPDGKDGVPD